MGCRPPSTPDSCLVDFSFPSFPTIFCCPFFHFFFFPPCFLFYLAEKHFVSVNTNCFSIRPFALDHAGRITKLSVSTNKTSTIRWLNVESSRVQRAPLNNGAENFVYGLFGLVLMRAFLYSVCESSSPHVGNERVSASRNNEMVMICKLWIYSYGPSYTNRARESARIKSGAMRTSALRRLLDFRLIAESTTTKSSQYFIRLRTREFWWHLHKQPLGCRLLIWNTARCLGIPRKWIIFHPLIRLYIRADWRLGSKARRCLQQAPVFVEAANLINEAHSMAVLQIHSARQ